MSESLRIAGWRPAPDGPGKVPYSIEFRYCPKDPMHWRVDGQQCPVCKSAIKVASYMLAPASPEILSRQRKPMAGSYNHCVDNDGRLLGWEELAGMLENGGDVFEAVEEMYGMIWYLASTLSNEYITSQPPTAFIETARQRYETGLDFARRTLGDA
jgi:hypothetical protein